MEPHLYELDMTHFTKTRDAGKSEPRCETCKGQHDDPIHVKHIPNCKDRYGKGSPHCPACQMEESA